MDTFSITEFSNAKQYLIDKGVEQKKIDKLVGYEIILIAKQLQYEEQKDANRNTL